MGKELCTHTHLWSSEESRDAVDARCRHVDLGRLHNHTRAHVGLHSALGHDWLGLVQHHNRLAFVGELRNCKSFGSSTGFHEWMHHTREFSVESNHFNTVCAQIPAPEAHTKVV
jgi:hypothetical protein